MGMPNDIVTMKTLSWSNVGFNEISGARHMYIRKL